MNLAPFGSTQAKAVEVLLSLSCESREEVDSLVAKALAAGGSTYDEPEDFGFMYTHSFIDLDCVRFVPAQYGNTLGGMPL